MKSPESPKPVEQTGTRVSAPQHDAGAINAPHSLSDADANTLAQTDSYVGRRIDNYTIEEVLGEGSFGRVYRARDIKLGRDVAIKFLKYSILSRDRELFRREAQGLAALSRHHHIVQIHTWGEYEGNYYFVLEYLPQSLGRLLHTFPEGLPISQCIRIIAETARGAHFAHQQGVLHADIKPDNILVDESSSVAKLADFGLMRFCEPGEAIVASQISGSPPYMAPEQVDNAAMDARTDVFALGVSLYQALSGKRPFEGKTALDVMAAISRHQLVPLVERRSDIPLSIVSVVDRAIAHSPEDRYQSASELADALEHAGQAITEAAGASTLVDTGGYSGRRDRAIASARLATVVACLAAVFTGLWLWWNMQPATVTQFLAQGREALEASQLGSAEELFAQAMHENRDLALYGLGYALLKQNRFNESLDAFAEIGEPTLREEGVAAEALHRQGEVALIGLANTQATSGSAYIEALVAALEVSRGEHGRAIDRLTGLPADAFNFRWQHSEALQSLGKAYLALDRYDEANRVFRQLASAETPSVTPIAQAYLALVEAQLDTQRREAIREQVASLKNAIAALPEVEHEHDAWRSRPLTFVLLPSKCRNSRLARQTGLADVMNYFLLPALEADTELQPVNRDFLDAVLLEQELSIHLSAGDRRLALREFLGGRFMIECEFMFVNGREFVNTKIVNTESTIQHFPDRVTIEAPVDPEIVSRQVAQAVWKAIREAYPLQGYLIAKNGQFEIDIGSDVGVTPGMQFQVGFAGSKRLLPERFLTVTEEIGPDFAIVALESGELGTEPDGGWIVVEIGAADAFPVQTVVPSS